MAVDLMPQNGAGGRGARGHNGTRTCQAASSSSKWRLYTAMSHVECESGVECNTSGVACLTHDHHALKDSDRHAACDAIGRRRSLPALQIQNLWRSAQQPRQAAYALQPIRGRASCARLGRTPLTSKRLHMHMHVPRTHACIRTRCVMHARAHLPRSSAQSTCGTTSSSPRRTAPVPAFSSALALALAMTVAPNRREQSPSRENHTC